MPFGFVFRSSNAVQIAAYSLLLEEKFNTNISLGKVFYTRSLVYDVIPITKTLRSKVLRIKNEIKKILTSENLPPPLKGLESIKCNYCVFKNECSNLQTNEKFSIQSIECANDINLGCEDVK
jgi:CRISPR/Cas system-associated exonuclease Cas4 (RecB family)